MSYDPRRSLDLQVNIALGCLRPTAIRAFAGRGRSRRRELGLADTMADKIATDLTATLRFSRDGAPVIRSRVARHITEVFRGISDATALAWAGLDATARDDARAKIADQISQRLVERYTINIIDRPTIVPSANVWCGLTGAEDEA